VPRNLLYPGDFIHRVTVVCSKRATPLQCLQRPFERDPNIATPASMVGRVADVLEKLAETQPHKLMNPQLENFLPQIGAAVVVSQTVERVIKTVLLLVLQGDDPLTASNFNGRSTEMSKKTLGLLFQRLRERADYHPLIEEAFKRHLAARNSLIHQIDSVPGSKLQNSEDVEAFSEFLRQFSTDTNTLFRFFSALIYSWGKKIGIPVDTLVPERDFEEMERLAGFKSLLPFLDDLIYAKA